MRIITCSKYNSHTSPIFKSLNILKIEDIFKINLLKFLYKFQNNLLPKYFDEIFTTVVPSHEYDTRTRDNERLLIPRTSSALKTVRHHLPRFIQDVPDIVKEKIYTHSFKGFTHYAKMFFVNSYSAVCAIRNCYVCNN